MIRTFAAAALLFAAIPAQAAPGDMNVATFLEKAERLQARGALAMFSGDVSLLTGEAQGAGRAYRTQLAAERRAGRPSSCPPDSARMNSEQLLTHLRTYAPAQRQTTSMRSAMADLFRKNYPCP